MYEIIDLSNEKNGYYTYQLKRDKQVVVLLKAHREREYQDAYILRLIDATPLIDIDEFRTDWPVPYFMISRLIQEFLKNNITEDILLIDASDSRYDKIIEDFDFHLLANNYFGSISIDTLIQYLSTQTKTYAFKNYYPVTEYKKESLVKKAIEVYESHFEIKQKNKLPFSYWNKQLTNSLDLLNSVVLYPTKTIRGYAFLYKSMFEVDLGYIFYDSTDSKERVVSSLIASLRELSNEIDEVFLNIRAKDMHTSNLFDALDKSDFFIQSVYRKMKKSKE